MQLVVNGVGCEYELNNDYDTDTVVFLHGWGGNLNSFHGAYKTINSLGINSVNIAFPSVVPKIWGVYDYASYVKQVLNELNVQKPILVGHSFGGRVAIILSAQKLCKKLVLVDAAGLKPKTSIKKQLRIARYKASIKKGKLLDGAGSIDYNNTSGDGRAVFVRIVNTHLDGLLPYIDVPTLIMWGDKDKETPLYMAKRLKRGIKNSRIKILRGGHYSYVDSEYAFTCELKKFITET